MLSKEAVTLVVEFTINSYAKGDTNDWWVLAIKDRQGNIVKGQVVTHDDEAIYLTGDPQPVVRKDNVDTITLDTE